MYSREVCKVSMSSFSSLDFRLPFSGRKITVSLAADRGREKGRPFGSMERRRNETTWQGIRTFGKPQAKGLVGISGERNRNGNLVQSKGFLLIVASTQRRVDRHQNRKLRAKWNAEHANV